MMYEIDGLSTAFPEGEAKIKGPLYIFTVAGYHSALHLK